MSLQPTLQHLATHLSTAAIGKNFFSSLAQYLSQALQVDYVFIGELTQGAQAVRSVVFWAHGQPHAELVYPLVGSLCEHVVKPQFCAFPRQVQQQFPDNAALRHFGVDSYLGTPLVASDGKVIGLIYLMHHAPIEDVDGVQAILQIVATRAESELERTQQEALLQANALALAQANDELRAANQDLLQTRQAQQRLNQELAAANEELRTANQDLTTTQQQLQQLNEQLEARVAKRTQALQAVLHQTQQQREQLQQQQGQLQRILGQVPASVATLMGPEHRFGFFNTHYQALSGNRTVLGQTVAQVFPEVVEQGFIELLDKVYTTGQPFIGIETPTQLYNPSTGQPEQRYIDFIYQPLVHEAGFTQGILAFILDTTEKVLARQQLEKSERQAQALSEELAAANEEIRASNEHLSTANEQLQVANQQLNTVNVDLDNFVYAASHDLKSPVTSLQSLLAFLQKRLADKLDDKEREMLALIQASSNRLQKTILDLTQIAQTQRNTEQFSDSISLREILAEVQAELDGPIGEADTQLTIDLAVETIAYARKNLRSIVYNLVSNAIKYRSADRILQVSISTKLAENGRMVLTVSDNGLGLSEAQLGHLFTMFKRFHNHVEGSGVGLYMIKRIVENNGGSIHVDSVLGEGTSFHVCF